MISRSVERWKNHLTESTWQTYSSWWKKFLQYCEMTPAQLLKLDSMKATDLAAEFHSYLQRQNYSSNSCACAYTTVRSFFAYNGVKLAKAGSKFEGLTEIESGRKLTQKEVFELIEAIPNYRDKGAVGILFQGGQRNGIVCCLKLKHIITRNWESASIVVFDVPRFVPNEKGDNVNKRRIAYKFGILNDVARFISIHLKNRRKAGEKLTSESWVFRSRVVGKTKVTFSDSRVSPIKQCYLNQAVKFAAERIGIQSKVKGGRNAIGSARHSVHAHSGRLYYKTQMRLAGVDVELRDFMMGHKVAYGGAYDKFRVTEIVNAMKQARGRLALTPEPLDQLDRRKQGILDSARRFIPTERFAKLEQLIMQAKTTSEFEDALAMFKKEKTI